MVVLSLVRYDSAPYQRREVQKKLYHLRHKIFCLAQSSTQSHANANYDALLIMAGGKQEEAVLWCKETGVLSGRPFFDHIFQKVGCTVEWLYKEGDKIDASQGKVKVLHSKQALFQWFVSDIWIVL
jgi:hypothetical protein